VAGPVQLKLNKNSFTIPLKNGLGVLTGFKTILLKLLYEGPENGLRIFEKSITKEPKMGWEFLRF